MASAKRSTITWVVSLVLKTRLAQLKMGRRQIACLQQGWFAVLCLHLNWLLWAGLTKGLGVMLPTLIVQFAAQTWLIGWMVAIVIGVSSFAGMPLFPF